MKNTTLLPGILSLLFTLSIFSCKKDGKNVIALKTYSLELENAIIKDAKCGIDLSNGTVNSISEGLTHQEDIDIAYGYMMANNNRYERCFLAISYAGCKCGGSSWFSYGDASNPPTGYYSYSVKNNTKIIMGTKSIDFDRIFSTKKQEDLMAVFPVFPSGTSTDEAFFSNSDNLAEFPYVFFQTVKGKRGIIRIKGYTKNTQTDYQLKTNPIRIDVVVEK